MLYQHNLEKFIYRKLRFLNVFKDAKGLNEKLAPLLVD